MIKYYHKHFQIGILIIDIFILKNKWDVTITLTTKSWI